MNFTGNDLLEKVLEFVSMTPESAEWTLSKLETNPPRYIRLQQINSLMSAFFQDLKREDVKTAKGVSENVQPALSINSFLTGDFINQRDLETYSAAVNYINTYTASLKGRFLMELHLHDLLTIYQELINFKTLIYKVVNFNSGWLEAGSQAASFSIHLTNAIVEEIKPEMRDLDYVLELLINPGMRAFSEGELIRRFNYPKDNLNEIDIDYL